MTRRCTGLWMPFVILLISNAAMASLPEPYHTVFGTVMVDGQVQTDGVMTLVLDNEAEPIASYVLGSSAALGTLFAIRVPMGLGQSRPAGTAREGLSGTLFINNQQASRVTIGKPGDVQRLDFDTDLISRIPGISIADATAAEAMAGPQGADIAVELNLAFGINREVMVNWQTVDGTALAGQDYRADAGQVMIPACTTIPTCVTTAQIKVTIYDDKLAEGDPENHVPGEHFFVQLSSPVNADLLDAVSTIMITDDEDTPPAFAINDLSVVEPETGSTNTAFTVSLSHAWHEDVTVDVSDIAETAGVSDFSLDNGQVLIAAGELSTQVNVEIFSDNVAEADETFKVHLENASTGFISDAEGTGRIYQTPRVLYFVESHLDDQQGLDHLGGAIDVVQSPDGKHVYVASSVDNALVVFSRNADSGQLTYLTTYRDDDGGLENLAGLRALNVSPDGRYLYAAAFEGVSVFSRDPVDGALTLLEVEENNVTDTQSGDPVEGLAGPISIAMDPPIKSPVSKGGQHLYVAAYDDDAIAVFERDSASGLLTFIESIADTGCANGPGDNGLCGVSSVVVSADGAQLYATGRRDGTLAVFDRDTDSGTLTLVEVHNGVNGAVAVAVSADGLSVYVAAQDNGAVAIFDRAADGRLSFLANAAGEDDVLSVSTDVAVSQDGQYVYASGYLNDTVVVFERAANGALSYHEVEREGIAGVFGLNGAAALSVSADDRHVYTVSYLDGAATVFRRDVAPPPVDGDKIFSSGFEDAPAGEQQ